MLYEILHFTCHQAACKLLSNSQVPLYSVELMSRVDVKRICARETVHNSP